MCGIVGCVGNIWNKEEQAFKLLLQLDTIRGPHSTGIAAIGKNKGSWEYLKNIGTPWELMSDQGFGRIMAKTHGALIGHNRWATMGAINADNAHPFHQGNFVGVHNGTLRNRSTLSNYKNFDVDSENLYHNMDVEGVEETLKKLNGAFALVWYNIEEHKIYMVRNSERPLYVCKTKDGKTYFWASEKWMLKVALNKNNLEFEEPEELKVGKLVSFDVPLYGVNKDTFLPHVKDVEFYKAPTYTGNSFWGGGSKKGDSGQKVLPFVKSGLGSSELSPYINQEVVFSVVGVRSVLHSDFILCEVEDDKNPDLRIFTTQKTQLGKLLLNSSKFFKGRVKGFKSKEHFGNYLTVDHRSIRECDSNPEVIMLPHNGRMVSLEKWYKATEGGCGWCTDFPKIAEAEELTWLADGSFLCRACARDEEVLKCLTV